MSTTSTKTPKPKFPLRFQLCLAAVLVIFGIGLIIAGFIVPPLGVIDASVLVAFGEALTFVGSIIGMDYKYKASKE